MNDDIFFTRRSIRNYIAGKDVEDENLRDEDIFRINEKKVIGNKIVLLL